MPIEHHPFLSNRWLQNNNDPLFLEKWFINKNKENDILSFAYMPNKEIKSIFLGTFPIWEITVGPIENNNVEFFYGSVKNEFWKCLEYLTNITSDTLNNRLTILDTYNIGITDILQKVNRSPDNCNSDKCLSVLNYNNILNLKESYPKLKNIFITSGGQGPVANIKNSKNAASWLKDSFKGKTIQGFNEKGFIKSITVENNKFNLIYLYSPSGDANKSIQGVINSRDKFGIVDLKISQFRKLQWGYFFKKYHLENKSTAIIDDVYNSVLNNNDLLNYFNN
jgi:G:T/U-mismatch repair DNA glycosylase